MYEMKQQSWCPNHSCFKVKHMDISKYMEQYQLDKAYDDI